MYYLYRFLNDDNKVIYVGKTQNLIKRMLKHFNSGHLPEDCYNQVVTVQYLILKTKMDMDIKELYYINKDKPRYNAQSKHEDGVTIEFKEEEQWQTLSLADFSNHNKFNQVITLLEYALLKDSILLDESVDPDSFLMGMNYVKEKIAMNLRQYIKYFSRPYEVFEKYDKSDILYRDTKKE